MVPMLSSASILVRSGSVRLVKKITKLTTTHFDEHQKESKKKPNGRKPTYGVLLFTWFEPATSQFDRAGAGSGISGWHPSFPGIFLP